MPVLPPTIAVLLSLTLTAPEAYPGAAELAAEAPLPEWKPEGGTAAHQGKSDVHEVNKKMRRAGHTAIAGGAIAVLGLSSLVGGFVIYSLPRNKLKKLESENGGALPPGDADRQRAITMARVSPILMGVGAGVLVIGAVMAGVGAKRFKKLREEKRTTVAFSPMPTRRGGGLMLEVRF